MTQAPGCASSSQRRPDVRYWDAVTDYEKTIIARIRAERRRQGVTHAWVTEGMRAYGFTDWHRSTMSKVEIGQRHVLAAEILGLAEVLNVPAVTLLGLD